MWSLAFLLALLSAPCLAQKWVDDKGRVYYGERPAGIKVKPAPMTGGASSSIELQGGTARSGARTGPSSPGGTLAKPSSTGTGGTLRDNDDRMSVEDRERLKHQEERWARLSESQKQRIRQRQQCIKAGGSNC